MSKFIVDTTEEVNNTYRSPSPRGTYKDGFSPEFLTNKWHLQAVIEIRRHLLGKKGRRRWCSSRERNRDLRLIISTLHNRSRSLGLSDKTVMNIFKETKRGPDWWLEQEMLRVEDCEDEIRTLKKLMHGRKRSDNRRKWKRRTAWLEKMQEQGKAGKIIKSVLKAHAGRKHRDGLNLDTIKDGTGFTHVTPQAVHQAGTHHFQDWYSMPDHYLHTLHSVPD